jgi:hypothetical protein
VGLDPRHFLEHVVRPALRPFSPGYATPAAEQLVVGTAAQESSFRWLRQVGGGPALGLFQMEPATFRWLRDGFLGERNKAALREAVNFYATRPTPDQDELVWNLRLAAAYCRLRYIASPRPLPRFGDVLGLAESWKADYNTSMGRGKVSEFLQSWDRLVAPVRLWA